MIVRAFVKSDLDEILELFYNTIHTINANDYNKKQLDSWAVMKPDKLKWLSSLDSNITYVVELNGKIIGFGDLNAKKYIDRLFTHKDYQGIGVASKILSILENKAKILEYDYVYTEASITAKGFFESRGYKVLESQNKYHNGEIFLNYIMKKEF